MRPHALADIFKMLFSYDYERCFHKLLIQIFILRYYTPLLNKLVRIKIEKCYNIVDIEARSGGL